ncbi:MAG: UDP-glucose 4-epimerase GalE [Actinomycetota bacterium]|nr:UDP-glucose 4-epimerase GalE [Actinomycetota bacterium]
MTTWLLTGGAGYIGSHVLRALQAGGFDAVVLDDMSSGVRERVPEGVPFVEASVLDTDRVRAALEEHSVDGVVHLAAKKAVGESMEQPLLYYRENVGGYESLLRAMLDAGVDRMVFSSSAAVWGTPASERVTEDEPTNPISPYGETKLVCEWMLRDVARASGMRWASLRYFNVAGAGAPELADTSVANLIPLVFQALTTGRKPQVYGDDYPTRDGTCIRDYIHVVDLAEAHVAAARRLDEAPLGEIYNLGRGEGVTVKEVLDVARRVTGSAFEYDVVGRRAGDPPAYFADPAKVERELGWKATRDLEDMVASAWEARQARSR